MDEWDDNVELPHAPQVSSRSTTTAAVKNKLPAGATAALKNKKPAGVKNHVTKRETRVTATKNKCATVKAKPAAKAKLAAKNAKLNLGLSLSPTPDDLSSWLKANPWSKPTLPDVILTGSDCSGLGTDEECYKELGLSTKCMFACEKDRTMRKYFTALHGHPQLFYTDITVRTVYTECDIYTAGYPCQPWSLAGKGGGLNDTRGVPWIHGLEYIREKRPRLVVLEQVKGMLTRFKQIFDAIIWHLEHFGYHVRWRVLNTLHVGALPQNRERLYLVAIRQDSFLHKFKWPKPLPTRPLSDILDARIRGAGTQDLSEAAQHKVLKCVAAAKQKGIDVEKELLIVDASAGPTINNWCTNRVPCITRARAAAKGFYIVNLGRFTTLKELAMLQGWEFDRLNVPNIAKTWKGAAIGNGMTKPVLKAVLRRAVWSAGLVKSKPKRR